MVSCFVDHADSEHRVIPARAPGDHVNRHVTDEGFTCQRKHADIEAGLSHYEDLRLNAISHFVGTMIASLLPAISIFVLYFVHNMLARLGAIMAFSALFSFTLAVFTTAKRIEIFAATAAYVAVFLCLAFVMSPGLVLSDLFHAQLG